MDPEGGPRSKLGEASKYLRASNERPSLRDRREREASAAPFARPLSAQVIRGAVRRLVGGEGP